MIIYLPRAYTYPDRAGGTVKVMFFDFSTSFNNIRLALHMQVAASNTIVGSTGAPQGTVLSPYLFTLYSS